MFNRLRVVHAIDEKVHAAVVARRPVRLEAACGHDAQRQHHWNGKDERDQRHDVHASRVRFGVHEELAGRLRERSFDAVGRWLVRQWWQSGGRDVGNAIRVFVRMIGDFGLVRLGRSSSGCRFRCCG